MRRTGRQRTPSTTYRWPILFLSCVGMAGVYYSFDIPASLHQNLHDFMSPNKNFETRFNLLYTVYALPNTFLPLIGGKLVDRLGAHRSFVGFTALALMGQLVFALGAGAKSWVGMLVGRTMYGLGGESASVAASAILSHWFVGGELALACSLFLASGRVGSALNNFVSPVVANSTSTPMAMWVGVIFNATSAIAALLIGFLEKRAERRWKEKSETEAMLTALLLDDENAGEIEGSERIVISDISDVQESGCGTPTEDGESESQGADAKHFPCTFWLLSLLSLLTCGCIFPFNNVASGILLERNYFRKSPQNCSLLHADQCSLGTLQKFSNPAVDVNGNVCTLANDVAPVLPKSINITRNDESWEESKYIFEHVSPAIVDCGDSFWSHSCTKDYCDVQKRATEKAGRVMSIPSILSVFVAPVFGRVMDSIGRRAAVAMLSPVALTIAHITLATSTSSPVLPMFGLGTAYSLFAAVIWPSIPLSMDSKHTGIAFGVVTANINIASTVFPLVIASMYNSNCHQYIPKVEYFFVVVAAFAFFAAVCLNITDYRTGGKLNQTPNNTYVAEEIDISSIVSSDNTNYIS